MCPPLFGDPRPANGAKKKGGEGRKGRGNGKEGGGQRRARATGPPLDSPPPVAHLFNHLFVQKFLILVLGVSEGGDSNSHSGKSWKGSLVMVKRTK